MDRRTLLFIAISVAIIFGYQEFVLKRLQPPPGSEPGITAGQGSGAPSDELSGGTDPAAQPKAPSPQDVPEQADEGKAPAGRRVRVETPLYTVVLNTAGGRIESFTLSRYPASVEPGSPPLELIVPAGDGGLPLGVEIAGSEAWSDQRLLYETTAADSILQAGQSTRIELRGRAPGGDIVKRLTFSADEYPIGLELETPPVAALPSNLTARRPDGGGATVGVTWTKGLVAHHESSRVFEGAAAFIGGKLEQVTPKSIEEAPKNLAGVVSWAGFEDHYFLSVVAPDRANQVAFRALRATTPGDSISGLTAKVLSPNDAGATPTNAYKLFLGPKDRAVMDAAGHDLSRSLNLGWFGVISVFLLKILNLSHRVTGNYGLDIIVLTVLVKLAFLPLTKKSFESMREMQKLQPHMARIREKYKDDSQQMNQELMELYKRHKVNPLGGCLPMVLQIPVFFGLYQALASAIELRQAPFVGWITDLAAPERFEMFGWGVPVLTLLLGASMFVQQKMAPPAGDPAQQRIMMFMPLVFTYMFIGFPAGLTLYWLTNNVITIAQQAFILRQYPPVTAT